MFKDLVEINRRPEPFQFYTANELWTEAHTANQMLAYHLNDKVDASSRNSKFIEESVEWIVSHFHVDKNTAIADFGCGPGLYANRLAERGATVTGIDFSDNSLRYARKIAADKGLKTNYVHADYLGFETTSQFDLIIMIMCDFGVLSPEQRKKLLTKFNSLLKPGGSVLLDVHSLNYFRQREESGSYELNQLNGFWSPDDYYCFVNTFKYEQEKVIVFSISAIAIIIRLSRRTDLDYMDDEFEEDWEDEFDDGDDYDEDIEDLYDEHSVIENTVKIGRNSLCHCGSGLKYKRCCGKVK